MNVGIDLGTSYSLVARMGPHGAVAIPDFSKPDPFTPSQVYISPPYAFVGRAVEAQISRDPRIAEEGRVRYFFKRNLGETQPEYIDEGKNEWHPEAIAALMLRKLKRDAEVSAQVDGAVITVPHSFNDLQRQAVRHAAIMAEVPLIGMLDEPVAAAIHYMGAHPEKHRKILSYDFGGGTFDVTIMELNKHDIKVLATEGDAKLGGKDVDDQIAIMIRGQFEAALHRTLEINPAMALALRRNAEEVKKDISLRDGNVRRVIVLGAFPPIEFVITKDQFKRAIDPLVERTIEKTLKCVNNANLEPGDIDTVLLVGGSSLLPSVKERIKQLFRPEPLFHEPAKAVALGAAVNAAEGTGEASREILGVAAYGVGVRMRKPQTGELWIDTVIKKNARLPARESRRYYAESDEQQLVWLEVVQYRDGEDPTTLGNLRIEMAKSGSNRSIDVTIENQENGTVRVEAIDTQSGSVLVDVFSRDDAKSQAMLLEQKKLVQSVRINPT